MCREGAMVRNVSEALCVQGGGNGEKYVGGLVCAGRGQW